MHRFFVPGENIREGKVLVLAGSDIHHLTRVLRLGVGDRFVAVVPGDREYTAEIYLSGRTSVAGRIIAERRPDVEPAVNVTLVQGMPKGEKLDQVVQKCAELGVGRIIPLRSERAVARPDYRRAAGRLDRWQRIAREAAEQSGRLAIPQVLPPADWGEALEHCAGSDLILLAWEGEKTRALRDALRDPLCAGKPVRSVAIIVGPEGGFTAAEVDGAVKGGAVAVSLGPRILRTETAGPALLAMVLYELGDLGG